MLDGGVRRGTDVIKALALGAHLVWIGRPFLYAAIAGGEPAVQRAITLLQARSTATRRCWASAVSARSRRIWYGGSRAWSHSKSAELEHRQQSEF